MLVDSKVVRKNKFVKSKNKFHIISYGCQMNFADSEVVASILEDIGYKHSDNIENSNLILLNTCSIREKAEQTIRKKLSSINFLKKKNKSLKIGVLGCMAERLKEKFLHEEKIVDLVVGPDAYRDLPNLLKEVEFGNDAVNVLLSKDETYADINPQRFNSNGISAFVSITRGCDNMCTFCVVPFTRGRERSRDPKSILAEIKELEKNGYKEITLLGQNVDSYLWYGGGLKKDFKKASDIQKKTSINFAKLLDIVAKSFPKFRIRFTTSNPQDMDNEVLITMKAHNNICNHIHLPVQSGSDKILKEMNRQHTREEYLNLVTEIKTILPDCGISQDMITGFPNETEKDHLDTLSLMNLVKYDFGFMFKYSERPGTLASRKLDDNIPEEIKQRRLSEIIDLQFKHSFENLSKYINKKTVVLIEKESKKSKGFWAGRNEQNIMVVFPKQDFKTGDFVEVLVEENTATTLKGLGLKRIK
ncbi:MAG: tRNA (N6-isopentenyl adenosine(37)-C2)-methylthiotransferase MiaB [Flavobacteriaceae bacterium]|jgi:tRNA-2-methylthio-N6-dimethylallyladenosine synthase|tara:strand:- start:2300 stop:3721 length:1422 start_codon:yes stop_codon:yes gene_type:complete